MHVQRIQMQYRTPWAPNPDGYYYWTEQFYYDEDNPPEVNTSRYWINVAQRGWHATCVEHVAFRISDPPVGNNWIEVYWEDYEAGSIPVEEGYSLINTVYAEWLSAGKVVGYNRLRVPVPNQDAVDGHLSESLWIYLTTYLNTWWLYAKICSREGLPIDEVRVSRRVHDWQLRHGTKRRERKVFEYM